MNFTLKPIKNLITIAFVLHVIFFGTLLLTACNNQPIYYPEINALTTDIRITTESYQDVIPTLDYQVTFNNSELSGADYIPITFTTTMSIHEDMPLFTFNRTLGGYVSFPDFIDEERYVTITIMVNVK